MKDKIINFFKLLNVRRAMVYIDDQDEILYSVIISIGFFFWFLILAGWFVTGNLSSEGFRVLIVLTFIWGLPTILTNLEANEEEQK